MIRVLKVLVPSALLAACSGEQPTSPTNDTAPTARTTPSGSASADSGGEVERRGLLLPVRAADVTAIAESGELACTFANLKGHALLLARADVASDSRPVAVARGRDGVVFLSGIGRGGFNALEKRVSLAGDEVTIWIETTGEPLADRSESATRTATLRFTRGEAEPMPVPGTWTCGP